MISIEALVRQALIYVKADVISVEEALTDVATRAVKAATDRITALEQVIAAAKAACEACDCDVCQGIMPERFTCISEDIYKELEKT